MAGHVVVSVAATVTKTTSDRLNSQIDFTNADRLTTSYGMPHGPHDLRQSRAPKPKG
jgi:hypothetical protein